MTAKDSATGDREIVLTRLLKAPRETVWKAWTEPERLIQWWGPKGFTNTFHEISVKPGGVWDFVMHGPDGTDYDNYIIFREIVKPERIVYDHGEDASGGFRTTVTMEEEGRDTRLTMRMVFPSAEERDKVVKEHGAIEGGNQTVDKLEAHLATM